MMKGDKRPSSSFFQTAPPRLDPTSNAWASNTAPPSAATGKAGGSSSGTGGSAGSGNGIERYGYLSFSEVQVRHSWNGDQGGKRPLGADGGSALTARWFSSDRVKDRMKADLDGVLPDALECEGCETSVWQSLRRGDVNKLRL